MNTKDELLITDVDFGGPNPGEELRLQIRWKATSGDAVECFVNGRPVLAETYDRILATARSRSLDQISWVLNPDNEDGLAHVMERIHDAINENDDGEHPVSLVDAINKLTAALPD